MSTPWTLTIKQATPHRHGEPPGNTVPVPNTFTPPAMGTIHVAPLDLFKSVARCNALSRSSSALVSALTASSQALLEFLVDDPPLPISFIDEVLDLADAERTALAGRIGAGITDQTMEMLGFVWRDIAEELIASSGPLADYVYESSSGDLVLAEAKGSVSVAATQAGAGTRARNAYHRQVDPYVYLSPPGAKGKPPVGLIKHGYVIALAALPEQPSSYITADAFLAVAETDPTAPALTSAAPSSETPLRATIPVPAPPLSTHMAPSPPLRLGNYRAVFLLSNARDIVDVIDALLAGRDPAEHQQQFARIECGGREFLIGTLPFYEAINTLERYMQGWIFAIEAKTATFFLEQLQNYAATGPLQAPHVLPLVTSSSEETSPYLLSPDGFAMLRRGITYKTHNVAWSLTGGLISSRVPRTKF